MRKLSIFEKFVAWFKSLFISKEKSEENSNESKRKMCESAVRSGVCPHTCDICAWNTRKEREE